MQFRSFSRFLLATVAALSVAAGCGGSDTGDSAPASTHTLQAGLWRAVVILPGGELPFGLSVQTTADGPTVHLVNGAEKVHIREVSADGTRWRFRLPAFNSTIDATLEDGELLGTLTLIKRDGVEQVMPFSAVPAAAVRIPPRAVPAVDITGRWEVLFFEDLGTTQAVGEFQQGGAALTGTFLTPTGDYRYLAGHVEGRDFQLSCFDGAHAFLFKGRVEADGSIAGDFWSGTAWHETWMAERNELAALPDPESITRLRNAGDRFTFDFVDMDGTRVSDRDSRFQGKVVIVAIEGSWCPNCHDAAAYLSQLYKSHHAAGLEIVGLMYEHYPDFERASTQVRHFARKHRIDYPLLVAGYSDKADAAGTLPALSEVVAYPTLVVIGREGDVRRIHTGFTGPGTGHHYHDFVREFTGFIEGLLDQ
jgi:peroxiredoxin